MQGWSKMVNVVTMPAIIAVATPHRKKTKPAHEKRGAPHHLCITTTTTTAGSFFWQQPNNVIVNAPPRPSRDERTVSHGEGGMENNSMLLLLSAADQSKLPRVMQNPLPTAGPILCFHCCIIGLLWYLFRVFTYHTHVTTL